MSFAVQQILGLGDGSKVSADALVLHKECAEEDRWANRCFVN